MEVKGKIKMVGETETVGSNGFRKRDVVVTTDEQYPQHILIQFVQDKTDLLDNHKVGTEVTISINLRGREWTSPQGEVKYFNTLNGWRIEAEPLQQQTPAQPTATPKEAFEPVDDLKDEDQDDLPF